MMLSALWPFLDKALLGHTSSNTKSIFCCTVLSKWQVQNYYRTKQSKPVFQENANIYIYIYMYVYIYTYMRTGRGGKGQICFYRNAKFHWKSPHQVKMSSCSTEHQLYPGLHQKQHDQHDEWGDSAPLLHSSETPHGILGTALGPSA